MLRVFPSVLVVAAFAASAFVAGCQPASDADTPDADTPDAEMAADSLAAVPSDGLALTPPEPVEGAETSERSVALTGVIATDDGCYLTVDEDGYEGLLMADGQACGAAAMLEGQPVVLTMQPSRIGADCGGAADCPDSQEVDLVVGVTAGE